MEINHPAGIVAVLLAIISFYGMTYVVIALNTGWRFGYWISGATLGALMVLMSIFWLVTALGPQGTEARWVPLDAADGRIAQVKVGDKTFTSVSQYPSGPWKPAGEGSGLEELADEFESGIINCLTTAVEALPERDHTVCEGAQKLLPPDEDIPIIDGTEVVMLPELEDVRIAEDGGASFAQGTVLPITHDPRVAKDAEKGELLGEEFRIVAVRDKGSMRVPAMASIVIFLIFTAIHLLGLHRAEQRKMSPVA